jgi:hypothetical protein
MLSLYDQGWLWSRLPLSAANFIIEFEFKARFKPLQLVRLVDTQVI